MIEWGYLRYHGALGSWLLMQALVSCLLEGLEAATYGRQV